MTWCCGKSLANVLHMRIVEEPMKRIAPLGGGLSLSAASKAAISGSHLAKSCGTPEGLASLGPRIVRPCDVSEDLHAMPASEMQITNPVAMRARLIFHMSRIYPDSAFLRGPT